MRGVTTASDLNRSSGTHALLPAAELRGVVYEAVHAHPDGDSTVARFAATAASDGYDGVVVRNRHGARPEVDYAAVAEEYGLDVVEGVEVVAEDRSQASG